MSAKHTPGPWRAHFEEAYFVTGPDLGRVAMMMNLKGAHGLAGRRSGDESAANCRLIAAAPELNELLATFTEWARHVAASEDVPRGIRNTAAQLADDGRRMHAKATGEQQ